MNCFIKLWYNFGSLDFVFLEITSQRNVAGSQANLNTILVQGYSFI